MRNSDGFSVVIQKMGIEYRRTCSIIIFQVKGNEEGRGLGWMSGQMTDEISTFGPEFQPPWKDAILIRPF